MTHTLKQLFVATGAAMLALQAQAAEEVIVYVKGEARPAFNCWLAEKPVITFGENCLTLKNADVETTLEFADIDHIEFMSNDTEVLTDIEEVEEHEQAALSFSYLDGQTIEVTGASEDAPVQLYSLDGKAAPLNLTRSNDRISVSLRNLQKGIYILRVDKQTYKIFKK